ncbi:MAG: hypothetical protein U1A78_15670 [Polyangia bacterium]
MPCHIAKSRGVSARRRQLPRKTPASLPLPSLAVLNLDKPSERAAHDFLVRATSKHDRMWTLLILRRLGDVLLCVVRWVHSAGSAEDYSLVEVSLIEAAVHWRYFASAEAASAEMQRRLAVSAASEGEV